MNIDWAPPHMLQLPVSELETEKINQSPSLLWPVLFYFILFFVWWSWGCGWQIWHLHGGEAVWKPRQHLYGAVLRRPLILLLWPSTDWTRPTHIVGHNPLCCCSVAQLCLTLCDPVGCGTPGFPVHHHLLELAQTHLHWVSGAIQPSHPLLPPSPPAFILSQYQSLFQWVSSLHLMAKIFPYYDTLYILGT